MEISVHTGCQGAHNIININWFDENNVKVNDVLEIYVKDQDKPREIELIVNNVVICTLKGNR
jgi:hypothetical protein